MAADPSLLLRTFRDKYNDIEIRVQDTLVRSFGDVRLFKQLGDELDDYGYNLSQASLLISITISLSFPDNFFQHHLIFDPSELETIHVNIRLLQSEVRDAYRHSLDASHQGRPIIIERVRTGSRGRPKVVIDPSFLQWASGHRGTTGIARFLGVSRTTVRHALLDYGLASPGPNPFLLPSPPSPPSPPSSHLELDAGDNGSAVDPVLPTVSSFLPPADPVDPVISAGHASLPDPPERGGLPPPFSDDDLDELVARLRTHFPRAGIQMLHGMLARLSHRVTEERIRQSLIRIDPVGRSF